MIVSINQPAYIPWLGYFDRIEASDLHIVLDHVQFEKNSLVNRNRIRTPAGWMWLTIPVATKGNFGHLAIRDLQSAGGARWRRKHWKALEMNYARTAAFTTHLDALRALYADEAMSGAFLPPVLQLNKYILEALGIQTKLAFSSEMEVGGSKSELVLRLCQSVGASTYLSGPFGRDYLDLAGFEAAGIKVLFHDYLPQSYLQAWPGFEPAMSALDALFCCGEYAAAVMRAGRRLRVESQLKEIRA